MYQNKHEEQKKFRGKINWLCDKLQTHRVLQLNLYSVENSNDVAISLTVVSFPWQFNLKRCSTFDPKIIYSLFN